MYLAIKDKNSEQRVVNIFLNVSNSGTVYRSSGNDWHHQVVKIGNYTNPKLRRTQNKSVALLCSMWQ